MIYTLMILLVMSYLIAPLLTLTRSQSAMLANFNDRQQSYWIAMGAVRHCELISRKQSNLPVSLLYSEIFSQAPGRSSGTASPQARTETKNSGKGVTWPKSSLPEKWWSDSDNWQRYGFDLNAVTGYEPAQIGPGNDPRQTAQCVRVLVSDEFFSAGARDGANQAFSEWLVGAEDVMAGREGAAAQLTGFLHYQLTVRGSGRQQDQHGRPLINTVMRSDLILRSL